MLSSKNEAIINYKNRKKRWVGSWRVLGVILLWKKGKEVVLCKDSRIEGSKQVRSIVERKGECFGAVKGDSEGNHAMCSV